MVDDVVPVSTLAGRAHLRSADRWTVPEHCSMLVPRPGVSYPHVFVKCSVSRLLSVISKLFLRRRTV